MRLWAVISIVIGTLNSNMAVAQTAQQIMQQYSNPSRMQHFSVDDKRAAQPQNSPKAAPFPKGDGEAQQGEKQQDQTAPLAAGTADVSEQSVPLNYMAKIDAPEESEPTQEDAQADTHSFIGFSVLKPPKAGNVQPFELDDSLRFPPLGGLTKWPWITELTYAGDHPSVHNALEILQMDLSKASPLAMIWAAQHYYDLQLYEQALFLYLTSRLRASVDQARFNMVDHAEIAAEDQNRTAGRRVSDDGGLRAYSGYQTIATSIGKPILKYGLRNTDQYEAALESAMYWDYITPYGYLPSINGYLLNDERRPEWGASYQRIREVYERQMRKLIKISSAAQREK